MASGSPGRGPEKGSQPSPKPQGGAIEPAAKVLPDGYKPDRDAQDRADAWFSTKFFKKGGIGDEWKKIVAACKTLGMPDKVKWRDWLKEQWDANRAVAVGVLITAGEIPGPDSSALLKAPDLGDASFVLAQLEANPQRDFTVDDLIASVKRPVGGAFDKASMEAALTRLVDAGLVWEPLLNRYRAIKGAK